MDSVNFNFSMFFPCFLTNLNGKLKVNCFKLKAKFQYFLIWYSTSLTMWQFYKSFSSGLKDVVWKAEENTEELR